MHQLAAAALAALLLSACAALPDAGPRRFGDPLTVDAAYPPAIAEVSFESSGDRLNGIVYLANGAGPHPTVILLHGFPGNEKNLDLAQALRAEGFNVLFFHYRGAWGSEGDYTFTHVIEDVGAAATFLRAKAATYRTDPAKLITVGHSMGGFASLQGAARDPGIACAAAIAPADMGLIARAFAADPHSAQGFAAYANSLQMLAGLTGDGAISEIRENAGAFDLRALAPKLAGKSVLIVGGDADTDTPADSMVRPLIDAYEGDSSFSTKGVILSGDHSFSWSRAALIETVADWAESCR